MWTPLQGILSKKIRSLGLGKEMEFFNLKKDWDEILVNALGPDWSKKSKPVKLKNKCLIVDCLNSVWANELQMQETNLLKKVSQGLKSEIERIRFIN